MNESQNNIDDGGAAFPSRKATTLYRQDGTEQTTMVESGEIGMSLRQWYVGKALQNPAVMAMLGFDDADCKAIASRCVAVADAVLKVVQP